MSVDRTMGSAASAPAGPTAPHHADSTAVVPKQPGATVAATSPTAESPASARSGPIGQAWQSFTRWRRSRPFWGGLFILLASGEILLSLSIPLPVMLHIGLLGAAAYIVPIIMVLCGLLLWFNPAQRMFYSILAVVMSLLTWITSNLGGFFFGILLGLIGGSLAFAWAPGGLRSRRARRKVASTPGDTSDRA